VLWVGLMASACGGFGFLHAGLSGGDQIADLDGLLGAEFDDADLEFVLVVGVAKEDGDLIEEAENGEGGDGGEEEPGFVGEGGHGRGERWRGDESERGRTTRGRERIGW